LVGVRRVSGLRREEVASLAGVSADYYTRLEQGRERNPSGQVVDAIARALRLSADGREHMLRLAGVLPAGIRSGSSERVEPAVLQLLDSLHDVGAYVASRVLDVLAMNALAREMFAPLDPIDNIARTLFCDPRATDLLADWPTAAENAVQTLRLAGGYQPRTELDALVSELSVESREFERLWRENRPSGRARVNNILNHKDLGPVAFNSLAFDVHGVSGQQLVLLFAEPGSASAQSLAFLGRKSLTLSDVESRL
jgi:transcriptional regulator with XRE-family HTH domain